MRKAAIAAGIAAFLLALYAAAGYWLAPRLVLDALEKRARDFGAALTIEEVRTDPFAFAVDLRGIELLGPQGRRLAAARSVHVDIAWASLWGEAWTIERASVEAPYVEVVLGPDGELNWPVARAGSSPAGEAITAVRIEDLAL